MSEELFFCLAIFGVLVSLFSAFLVGRLIGYQQGHDDGYSDGLSNGRKDVKRLAKFYYRKGDNGLN